MKFLILIFVLDLKKCINFTKIYKRKQAMYSVIWILNYIARITAELIILNSLMFWKNEIECIYTSLCEQSHP